MEVFIKFILVIICVIVIVLFAYGSYRNFRTQTNPNQKIFLKGTVPSKFPDGFYKGTVNGLNTPWAGKEFNAKEMNGINIFKENEKSTKKYPFHLYKGRGLADKNLEVIKIDYNLPQNPILLRFIMDEIVETSKDQYLGKLHIRFPGFSFALGFFSLRK